MSLKGTMVAALAVLLISAAPANASPSNGSNALTHQEIRNERVTKAVVKELFNRHDLTAVDRYFREPFIQHSPKIANGFAGIKKYIRHTPDLRYDVYKVIADDDFVTVDSRVAGLGPTKIVMDIFRFDRGKIVEHWDVVQDEVPASQAVNGNPMISRSKPGGPTHYNNERIVARALDELLVKRDLSAVDRYWRDPYVQHAPFTDNGKRAHRETVRNLPADFVYEPGLIMGEGNEVVVHAQLTGIAPQPVIVVHIYRLDRGQIVEHWENIQYEVPARESANGNSMMTPRLGP
ncbi:nuclear transport factor 2 family protein [Streptomyces sp. NPDC026672]|uniref:nuclear transport factor 2 family protein n=1 Tax=unclassified Streptomyces TaxID=2593676 RepID=UPI0033E43723